jgi:Ca2+-binding EF-hand superfamily protein
MRTTLSTFALSIAALLAGQALSVQVMAGEPPRSDAMRGDDMRADKDGDGRVSRAEATAAATERTNEWFDKLDLDKDGYVTQEETRQARDNRRGEMRAMADEHFKAADTNADGSLSLDEAQANMPMLAERFTKLDKDKNGLLSREELKRGGGHGKPEAKN